ncbi:hypothetical protein CRUP_020560 [Coryphaenoides rupestris]|nr:hypothetical protein CRUP_020560 [Coryphaenoides rupestris]
MGKIVFYEERNFKGRSYECAADCSDMYSHFSRCNSIKVESGGWMVYQSPGYHGYQYFLKKGNYPDYKHWMGFNDCVRSCQLIPLTKGPHKIRIYERAEFGGQTMDLSEDCPSVHDRFHLHDFHSCDVQDGYWVLYEHPQYRGRQYLVRPGQYRRFYDWGCTNGYVGSIRRLVV